MKRTTVHRSRVKVEVISILYLVLTGLIVGTALGILMSPDTGSLLPGKIIGAALIGMFIGVSIGAIIGFQSVFLLSQKEEEVPSVLHFEIAPKSKKSAIVQRPPLI